MSWKERKGGRKTSRETTRPVPFTKRDVAGVLNEMSTKLRDSINVEIIRPISRALEQLQEVYANLLLLPEVPSVTVRTDTLQTLLDHFEGAILGGYPDLLRLAGKSVGQSFAEDFMQTLRRVKWIPIDLGALLSFWLEIESRARWGIFALQEHSQKRAIVEVEDFFLTKGLSDRIHRNCSFMEGYIESFLWETTKTCSGWYLDEYQAVDRKKYPEPTLVRHDDFGEKCRFQIMLKNEELTEAFDGFYEAKKAYLAGQYKEVAVSLRSAIEAAFKAKIGIEATRQAPVSSIIRVFRESNILPSDSHRMIKDVYGRSSAVIHGGIPATEEDSKVLLRDGGEVLKVLELTTLNEAKRRELQGRVTAAGTD